MAILGTKVNLLDLANLTHNGKVINMVYSMTEMQDILKDAEAFEANEKTSHRYTRNAVLPSGTWVDLNNGLDASKGIEVPGRAEIGMLESRLVIDNRFMDIEPDFEAFVARKAYAHYEGLGNDMADALVNNSVSGGSQFNSIEALIASASQTDQFGQNMFHTYAGTTGLTSILAVDWGMDKVYLVYPQGHKYMGVERDEHENQLVAGNNSKNLFAYVCDFKWYVGLVIADDRCVRRIGNITASGTSTNLRSSTYKMYPVIDALASMYNMGRTATLYMNRTIWAQLWKLQLAETNVFRDLNNPWKQPEAYFGNNRIRYTDSLLNTETAIS